MAEKMISSSTGPVQQPSVSPIVPRLPVRTDTIATFREEFKIKEQSVVCSSFLVVGAAEFISSVLLIVNSSSHLIGGVYLGGLSLIFGCCGFFINTDYYWFAFLTAMFVCSVVATVLQGLTFGELNGLQACSIYAPNHYTAACTVNLGYYDCFGDAAYYSQAESCAISYQNGENANTCSCTKASSASCASFPGIDQCDRLLDEIPRALLASLIFSIFLATISMISVAYRAMFINPIINPSKVFFKNPKDCLQKEIGMKCRVPVKQVEKENSPPTTERMNICDETTGNTATIPRPFHSMDSPLSRTQSAMIVGDYAKVKQKPHVVSDLDSSEV